MDGDATTLVLNVLRSAASQNSDALKPATAQLHDWETEQGFYTVLVHIFTDKSIDVNIRWQAILYVKNGVDRYWRRHSPGTINDEEKVKIRSVLLDNFHEPANQLAIQLAVVIGKIARLDCPNQWPELLPTLIEAITTVSDQLRQQRILLSFYQVVKCLSTKRLAHDRKVFEELTKNIFDFVLELWNSQMSQLDNLISQGDKEKAYQMLEYAYLTLKVLRKLAVYGFKEPKNNKSVDMFVRQCIAGLDRMLATANICPQLLAVGESWNKMILLYSKILLDMLLYHPETYIDYITLSLQLVFRFCFAGSPPAVNFDRFNVNLLNLMKDILNNDSYRPQTVNIAVETGGFALAAYQTIRSTMTTEALTLVLKVLVYRYLPLTPADLELWENDAEDYINEEGGDSYKYSLRACVETLFATIFKEYKNIVTPVLLEMVQETQSSCDPSDMETLLKRDSLYYAAGLAAYDVYDEVDFDSWMQSHLINELGISHPNYRIIKRRVIWLIGNWINVKLSVSARPVLYNVILKLLTEEEDLVVRMETAQTLKAAVDDFEFSYEQFSTFMEPSFHLLFKLLTHVQSCDSKMQVLHVMSFLIERSGSHITPHCQTFVHYLPLLWRESEEHNMLRCAIVTTLVSLVHGLSDQSSQLLSVVVPVIQLSTDISQGAHVYLLEDGLHLWQAVLYNSEGVNTPDILQLFTALPPLMEASTENLRTYLKIVQAYALLCGEQLMANHGNLLVKCLCSVVTDIKSEGLVLVLKTVEVFFKLFSRESSYLFKDLIISWIIPSILDGESYPMVMSLYLSIIARLTFENRDLFINYIAEFSRVNQKQQVAVLNEFLQMWFEKLDCISQSERRKICALAISTLIPTNLGASEAGLDPMVNACVEVMHDVCTKVRDDGTLLIVDTLMIDAGEIDKISGFDDNNAHEKRKRELSQKDPIFHVQLDTFVRSKLNELCAVVGQERFQHLMSSIDPDIAQQLKEFMNHSSQTS